MEGAIWSKSRAETGLRMRRIVAWGIVGCLGMERGGIGIVL